MARIERIVFFGTPEFAVPTLDALEAAGRRPHWVVTQPSRRAGRGRRLEAPPVFHWAEKHGVPVAQPASVKRRAFLDRMRELAPDLAVVVAFGQIFSPPLLAIPALGCMNLHASLLPAYRGASPIAAAIRAGDSTTGVSTMWMEAGLDSGPVLLQRSVAIGPAETTGELSQRLAIEGAALVTETLERLEQDSLEAQPQDDSRATFAPLLSKADGVIDWQCSATEIWNQIRALDPWPGSWTELRGQPLRILAAAPQAAGGQPVGRGKRPGAGTYLGRDGNELLIACARGSVLRVDKVQRPGKRAVSGGDLVNAERPLEGEPFGPLAERPGDRR